MSTLKDRIQEAGFNPVYLPPMRGQSAAPHLLHALARNYGDPSEQVVLIESSHPRVDGARTTEIPVDDLTFRVYRHTPVAFDPDNTLQLFLHPTLDVPAATITQCGVLYTHIVDDLFDDSDSDERIAALADFLTTALTYAYAIKTGDYLTIDGQPADWTDDHPLAALLQATGDECVDLRNQIDDTQTQITNNLLHIQRTEELITTGRNRLANLEQQLDDALKAATETSTTENLTDFYEYLQAQPLIQSWFLPDEERLRIITKPLSMRHEDINNGDDIRLGSFAVTIRRDGNIRCVNLTDRRGRRDHPHIVHGDFCTGAYATTLRSLLRQGKFIDTINLLLNFLQTFAPEDDYGQYWYLWTDRPADHTNFMPETTQPEETNNIATTEEYNS